MEPIHLLVLLHGLWGEPIHMNEMARTIRAKFASEEKDKEGVKLKVLVAETNSLDSTYDGFDVGGERIADEVQRAIEDIQADGQRKVTRFSVVGYSLGGLLSRYLVGILESRKFSETVKPVNFATFASPHIGLVKMDNFFSKLGFKLGPKMLSRTGPQLYGVDSWSSSGQTIMEVMADPKGIFYQGLAKFERLSLYGSAYGDRTVSYQTALIEVEDPFYDHEETGLIFNQSKEYPHLLESYEYPSRPPSPPPPPPVLSREYLKTKMTPRIRLPPFLQLRFPLNLVLYALLPVLIPMGLSVAYVKVSLDSSRSRKRLKVLEADDARFEDRLVNVLRRLDKQMEDAIVEMVENAEEQQAAEAIEEVDLETGEPIHKEKVEGKSSLASSSTSPLKPNASRTRTLSSSSSSSSLSKKKAKAHSRQETSTGINNDHHKSSPSSSSSSDAPVLSELQLKLIASLNTLPFHKYRGYFPGVFSAHAVIISRDVERFAFHKQGESILRHWADHFIL